MFFELAFLAYLIDMLFGELPGKHPVMWMGDFINLFERKFYAPKLLPGVLLVLSLLVAAGLAGYVLVLLSYSLPEWLGLVLLSVLASTGLAMDMLHRSVANVLTSQNPRQAIAYLVSRDTDMMTETDINKAGLETWAENLNDGVIAPLLYLVLFGLPGIAVYKAINTLDSMVGYKTERYYLFGKPAAKLDDLVNYLPARLTALLIVLLAPNRQQAWKILRRDGHKLDSPNAGQPIAAMAGALGVALGGAAYYHGQLKHKPILGEPLHSLTSMSLKKELAIKIKFNFVVLMTLALGAFVA